MAIWNSDLLFCCQVESPGLWKVSVELLPDDHGIEMAYDSDEGNWALIKDEPAYDLALFQLRIIYYGRTYCMV